MTAAAELAWENEGGRLRPTTPAGDPDTDDTPQAPATREGASTDTAPS